MESLIAFLFLWSLWGTVVYPSLSQLNVWNSHPHLRPMEAWLLCPPKSPWQASCCLAFSAQMVAWEAMTRCSFRLCRLPCMEIMKLASMFQENGWWHLLLISRQAKNNIIITHISQSDLSLTWPLPWKEGKEEPKVKVPIWVNASASSGLYYYLSLKRSDPSSY